jgi:hypothetical protein
VDFPAGQGGFADFDYYSDRLIDAIPGTYDEVKGKKYEGINRLVIPLLRYSPDEYLLTSDSGEYLVKRLTATY